MILYTNCNVYNRPDIKSILCNNGKIVQLLPSNNINAGKKINLNGGWVYPGFTDSHMHLTGLGFSLESIDLVGEDSKEGTLQKIKKEIKNIPAGTWIIGRGWDQNDWNNKTLPTNDLLNKSFPNKPVILRRIDGHAYLANDFALSLAGIDESFNVDGGEFIKLNGRLTGVLVDNAMRFIDEIIPDPTQEESIKALLSAEEIAFENGLTTISEAGISRSQIELIDSLQMSGVLKIKIYAMIENNSEDVDYFINKGPYKTERLNVRSVKVYADGALGSRGASMIRDYSDRKGYYGIIRTPIDSIKSLAFKLAGTKFQIK